MRMKVSPIIWKLDLSCKTLSVWARSSLLHTLAIRVASSLVPRPHLQRGKGSGELGPNPWGYSKSRNGEMRNEKLEMRKWKWSSQF